MRALIFAAAFAAALVTPAIAQTDRSGGTQAFVSMCVTRSAHLSTPEPTCACGAGVISGRMNDRQFEIMRRFAPHTGNAEATSAELQRLLNEGYTAQEIMVVGQMLVDLGPDIDRTCRALER
jgi:hypothetical protein